VRSRVVVVAAAVVVMAGLGALTGRAEAACATAGPGFQPAAGKTLLVIGNTTVPEELYAHGTAPLGGVGIEPGGTMLYTGIAAPASLLTDMQVQAQRFPRSALQIGVDIGGQGGVTNINDGLVDGQIKALAAIVKQTARPVYLRPGYEVERGSTQRSYVPADFVRAWKRIVDLVRGEGVTNVAWVWHLAASTPWNGQPISAWYPGDSYVDWVAVSLFHHPYPWGSMTRADDAAAFAVAHGKPLAIAESTPIGSYINTGNPTTIWNNWFVPVISWIAAHDVKMWSYINQNWNLQPGFQEWFLAHQRNQLYDDVETQTGQSVPLERSTDWGDAQVQDNPQMLASWKGEITKPRYLNASSTLFCNELGYG
jgi:hypothetical protein